MISPHAILPILRLQGTDLGRAEILSLELVSMTESTKCVGPNRVLTRQTGIIGDLIFFPCIGTMKALGVLLTVELSVMGIQCAVVAAIDRES